MPRWTAVPGPWCQSAGQLIEIAREWLLRIEWDGADADAVVRVSVPAGALSAERMASVERAILRAIGVPA